MEHTGTLEYRFQAFELVRDAADLGSLMPQFPDGYPAVPVVSGASAAADSAAALQGRVGKLWKFLVASLAFVILTCAVAWLLNLASLMFTYPTFVAEDTLGVMLFIAVALFWMEGTRRIVRKSSQTIGPRSGQA